MRINLQNLKQSTAKVTFFKNFFKISTEVAMSDYWKTKKRPTNVILRNS